MATYAKGTYNAARYALSRPTYPRQLYDFIFEHHGSTKQARWETAVDIGCGTGQATVELTPFRRIIGVDPSATMLAQAREGIATRFNGPNALPQIELIQAAAEDLAPLHDGSVDLVVAAQAGHWFKWDKVWREGARVLRKDGTFAAWGYSEFRLSRYPSATPLIHTYSRGSDPHESVGPCWEQPGRAILDNHLLDVPDPTQVLPGSFSNFERVFFAGSHHQALPTPRPVILQKTVTWEELLDYFRSWSSLHTYHEQHPEDLQHPGGDIAVRFWRRLREEVGRVEGKGVPEVEDRVDIEWPLALVLARRA